VLEPPLDPRSFPDADALNAAVAAVTERHIASHLDQWCIFRPLWSAASEAEPRDVRATARARA
jgi:hypothetical protein